jgi:hypothetical protein
MKKLLTIFAGMLLVLAFGIAYADELQPGDGYSSDKMIRNEDIQKYDQDMGQGTVNQMPALPDEVKGSAAGGGSKDTESDWKSDTYEKNGPVEKDMSKPSGGGSDRETQPKNLDPYRY